MKYAKVNPNETVTVPKAVWGALISAGTSLIGGVISSAKEKRMQQELEERNNKVFTAQKMMQDATQAKNFATEGVALRSFNVGGMMPQASNLEPVNGALVQQSSDMEKVKGPGHESGGTVVARNGQPVAELEGEEMVKDGQKVYSDSLSPDGKKTFAQLAEDIAKKKGKLEKELNEGQLPRIKQQTLEREIEKLDIASDQLFQQQEQMKAEQGIEQEYAEVQPMMNLGGLLTGGPGDKGKNKSSNNTGQRMKDNVENAMNSIDGRQPLVYGDLDPTYFNVKDQGINYVITPTSSNPQNSAGFKEQMRTFAKLNPNARLDPQYTQFAQRMAYGGKIDPKEKKQREFKNEKYNNPPYYRLDEERVVDTTGLGDGNMKKPAVFSPALEGDLVYVKIPGQTAHWRSATEKDMRRVEPFNSRDEDKMFDKAYPQRVGKDGKRYYGRSYTDDEEVLKALKNNVKNEREGMKTKKDNTKLAYGGKIKKGMFGVVIPDETATDTVDPKYADKSFLEKAAPYADNLANLALTAMKPKVPAPALAPVPSMNTSVNVNAQLNNVSDAVERSVSDIDANTSSKRTARGQKAQVRLAGSAQQNQILQNQENQQNQLENQAALVQQGVVNANVNTLNQNNQQQMMRALAINTELSDNVANAVDDFGAAMDIKEAEKLAQMKTDIYREAISKGDVSLAARTMMDDPVQINKWRQDPESFTVWADEMLSNPNVDASTKRQIRALKRSGLKDNE